ncbi:alpha/beta fold hydrolase [Pedobacter sp. AW31-3R]|uniref:alpha/beta fold hydrolase n=1 Tax=Pedobacter sp. AW31-3R TaxID=3445781 RepID=UPI003FA07D9B
MDIIKRNNVNILGKGKQTMMFAHGFGCDQATWRLITPDFEDDYQIILFDYVGAGNADAGAYDQDRYSTLGGYVQDVIDIAESLGLQDVIFVGHSISCMVGVLASIKNPYLFSKLILIGPSPRYLNDENYYGGMDLADLNQLLEVMDSNYLDWSGKMAPAIIGNPERPELGKELTVSFIATDPELAKNFARVTFLADNRADLPFVSVPSLTIQCKEDLLASEKVATYIKNNTPGNTMLILDSCGHCPHISDPENVIKAIKDYIK